MAIASDLPEFQALAQLSKLDPDKMAAAFSDAEHFFDHMTLEELNRLKEVCGHFTVIQTQMIHAMDVYNAYGKGLLEGMKNSEPVGKEV